MPLMCFEKNTNLLEGPSCLALKHAVSCLYRLDDFFCEKIASGFFSDVYKVIHKTNGQVMVLKVNNSCLNRPNVLKEVEFMNNIRHPNIIRLMGVCVHGGLLHALTEFANGGCLEQMIKNPSPKFNWTTKINIATDVARAMNHLHSRSVMHRDLTSKNILLKIDSSQQITALVGDLGLATKIPNYKDAYLPVVGSPYWMAPECLAGLKYNEKVDVFSYGIVLCEMIGQVDADPDFLPRTKNFGVDYIAFTRLAGDCPILFLHYAFDCCQVDPTKRPSFSTLISTIEVIRTKSLKATVLADLSRFFNEGENVTTTQIILKIFSEKENKNKSIFTNQLPSIIKKTNISNNNNTSNGCSQESSDEICRDEGKTLNKLFTDWLPMAQVTHEYDPFYHNIRTNTIVRC